MYPILHRNQYKIHFVSIEDDLGVIRKPFLHFLKRDVCTYPSLARTFTAFYAANLIWSNYVFYRLINSEYAIPDCLLMDFSVPIGICFRGAGTMTVFSLFLYF